MRKCSGAWKANSTSRPSASFGKPSALTTLRVVVKVRGALSDGGSRIATNWFTAWTRYVAGELVEASWAVETRGSKRQATTRPAARRDIIAPARDRELRAMVARIMK